MSDAAFKTAPYSGYTTEELRKVVAEYVPHRVTDPARAPEIMTAIQAEIARRERVAEGDVSIMTDGERLRYGREFGSSLDADQAKWASEHDWFHSAFWKHDCLRVIVAERATQNGKELPVVYKTFQNFKHLRAWAGY